MSANRIGVSDTSSTLTTARCTTPLPSRRVTGSGAILRRAAGAIGPSGRLSKIACRLD